MKSRANPQIKRLSKYLFNMSKEIHNSRIEWGGSIGIRNFYYDKAAELLKKINNNEFVGGDNHSD